MLCYLIFKFYSWGKNIQAIFIFILSLRSQIILASNFRYGLLNSRLVKLY